MPADRVRSPRAKGIVDLCVDMTVQQHAQITLLATYWDTSKAAVIRAILDDHLATYIDGIYQEAEEEAKEKIKAKRSRQRRILPGPVVTDRDAQQ